MLATDSSNPDGSDHPTSSSQPSGLTSELLEQYTTWQSTLASYHGDFSADFVMSEIDMRDGIGGTVAALQVMLSLVTDPTFRGVHLFL